MPQTSASAGQRADRPRRRHRRLLGAIAVGAVLSALAASAASADYPTNNVAVYTGCLTPGSNGGQIVNVALSATSPAKPCAQTQTVVHLSGGTVTSVNAGPGLTGGGSDGAVTLGLGPDYALPQSCAAGNIPGRSSNGWSCYAAGTGLTSNTAANTLDVASSYRLPQTCGNNQLAQWNGASWQCADQTAYTNGTGLDLNGNAFSVNPGYQLPQGCSGGQLAAADGAGHWSCQNDATYSGANFALSNQDCPSGQFTTGVSTTGTLNCGAAPSGLSGLHVVKGFASARVTGGVLIINIPCPTGEVATGGGGSLDFIQGFPANNPMVDNGPTPSGTGWIIGWYITTASEQNPQQARGYAVCATQ